MTGERSSAGLILFLLLLMGAGHTSGQEAAMNDRLTVIQQFLNNFNIDTIHLADAFYDPDVVFRDPIVELTGRDKLKAYYADMYESVVSIRFDFSGGIEKDDEFVRPRRG